MPSDKRQRKRSNAELRRAALEAQQRKARTRRRAISIGLLVVILVGVIALVSQTGDDGDDVATGTTVTTAPGDDPTPTTATTAAPVEPTCPPAAGAATRTAAFTKPFPMCIDAAKTYVATFETSDGTFVAELDAKRAPKTVNNFVSLARHRYYDGLTFHRIVQDFVIQGGDPTATGSGGPGYEFEDELPEPGDYVAGSLAMANSGPNTNGSQFFVVVSERGANNLVEAVGGEAKYSLFGKVTSGLDVVQKINADPGEPGSPPKQTHTINRITIEER